MKERFFLFFIVSVIVGCTPEKRKDNSLAHLIPPNTAVTLKINDFESFVSEIKDNEILSKINSLPFAVKISKKIASLKYVNNQSKGLLTFSGTNDNFDFTYIPIDSALQLHMDSMANKTVTSLRFNNQDFKKYLLDSLEFYTALIHDREILSSSLTVLQNLRTLTESDNQQLKKFYRISDTTKLAQIWLNLNEGDTFLKQLFEVDHMSLPHKFADWISLDITLRNEEILLNGVSISQDSSKNYLGIFQNKNLPDKSKSFIPKNANSYASYTIADFDRFTKSRLAYLELESQSDSLFATVEEVGIANIANEPIVLIRTYGAASIFDYLKSIQKDAKEYRSTEIMELGKTGFLKDFLNPLVTDFKSSYVCVVENTFIFSENLETLQDVITDYKMGNTFEKSGLFKNAAETITEESSVLTLENITGFKTSLEKNISSDFTKGIKDIFFKDYLFGSQFVSEGNFLHTSYFIKKISDVNKKNTVSSLFKVVLDADIVSKPQFVTNHKTHKKEIAVQDHDNVLYLISNKGKILWKKQLDGRIQGKIHQVDIYRNGRLQLAFTTDNEFLIIDRNGKEVAPFTLKYEGGNLNPLAVFDYEGNKNYRFVVTQNNKVFMYNNKAQIVSGFKYTRAEENIMDAPQHFRIGQKDYLVFKLSPNKLKILNRVGDIRINIKENIPFSQNKVRSYKNTIALTTANGLLYQISPNGKIQKTDMGLNKDHGLDATSKTLAVMNDNILRIRDKKITLDLGVYTTPSIFYLNDKIYVSVTDIQNQKSYLFDSQSKAIPNFPIYGTSVIDMADMDNDKKPELIIKDQDNSLSVYKIR
ncbi:ribonuclease HII [Maribacter sp. 2304DJ31-5]|uniref:ribonuclease HII n=1 Tax=Maribacter sp. 2304DJ31-5 TaxID=3386273 RepID=UPI0039BC6E33